MHFERRSGKRPRQIAAEGLSFSSLQHAVNGSAAACSVQRLHARRARHEGAAGTAPSYRLAPVAGAYVVCIEQQAPRSSEPDAFGALRFGRTNDFGWVLLRKPGELGAPEDMPVSGWRKKELPPGGLKTPSRATGDDADEDEEVTDAMDAGVPLPRDLSMFGPDDADDVRPGHARGQQRAAARAPQPALLPLLELRRAAVRARR
jgi:hypothetical protein